jgi:hypothetical protein
MALDAYALQVLSVVRAAVLERLDVVDLLACGYAPGCLAWTA